MYKANVTTYQIFKFKMCSFKTYNQTFSKMFPFCIPYKQCCHTCGHPPCFLTLVPICCINRFTSLCKNLFNLLEFLAEAFRCHVHHFQCLTVPVTQVS